MREDILNALYGLITERKKTAGQDPEDKSYTKYLFREGLNKILKKVGEESAEVIIAAKDASSGAGAEDCAALLVGETADLLYHLLVMLAELDIKFEDVLAELRERREKLNQ